MADRRSRRCALGICPTCRGLCLPGKAWLHLAHGNKGKGWVDFQLFSVKGAFEHATEIYMPIVKVAALTAVVMIAFAGNSILCSIALKDTSIDAATFTSIRLVSGAAVLWSITIFFRRDQLVRATGSRLWSCSFMPLAFRLPT